MPDKAHQLARSVESKRTRAALKFESGFFRRAITFSIIATVAACYEIFPGRTATPRAGHHMVERELRSRQRVTAKLAGIAIAQQNVFSRKRAALLRDMAVGQKPNHRRHLNRLLRSVDFGVICFFRLSYAFEHQDQSASHGRDIDGFESCVQHQYGRLHHRRAARRGLWQSGSERIGRGAAQADPWPRA